MYLYIKRLRPLSFHVLVSRDLFVKFIIVIISRKTWNTKHRNLCALDYV